MSREHLRLGIGITTFNRRDRLIQVLDGIRRKAKYPHLLFVADDGSTDLTRNYLEEHHIPHISAINRGVAWNKNRLLFQLFVLDRCDVAILLEDDSVPESDGWDEAWIEAAVSYGHMNYAGPWMMSLMTSGSGTVKDPFRAPVCSGQCVAFSRKAVARVGFMDTRFKRYGFEHGDHTQRLIRAGFGGDARTKEIYLISSDITVYEGGVSRFEADVAENGAIYETIRNEAEVWRLPYRGKVEKQTLMSEFRDTRLFSSSRKLLAELRRSSFSISSKV